MGNVTYTLRIDQIGWRPLYADTLKLMPAIWNKENLPFWFVNCVVKPAVVIFKDSHI